ncbi:tetratricopeptide repeat protein [Aeromonas sp. 30P]|uniref:tetratricopeptide repeat protein n=1 Tax=Aeromonas sp. 30P TaxID=3452717 RepID=UPI003F7ACAAA
MNHKEIADAIRNKKFSELTLLDCPILLEQNKYYYGFRYFLLDAKGIDTSTALDDILKKHGSLSKAYEYLGTIARDIYPNIGDEYISESYFQRAVYYDINNTNAWWSLYHLNNDSDAFFKSLKLDYDANNFGLVSKKLNDTYLSLSYMPSDRQRKDDWSFLLQITQDDRVSLNDNGKQILALAYFHLGDFENGIDIINSLSKVHLNIASKYYTAHKIDKETVISKISIHEKARFLLEEPEKLYKEYLDDVKESEQSILKSSLMEIAFKAKLHSDVIKIYCTNQESDEPFTYKLKSKTLFAISKFLLGENIDNGILQEIKNRSHIIDIESTGLYKVFLLAMHLNTLEGYFAEHRVLETPIHFNHEYQSAQELLDDPELTAHFLYDDLYQKYNKLEEDWNYTQSTSNLKQLLEKESDSLSKNERINIFRLEIQNENYESAFKRINEFHDRYEPTITTYNLLGVCLERQNQYSDAYHYYKAALELMKKHSEYSYVIIGNYLKCANKIKQTIPEGEYSSLREKLNLGLVSEFIWNMSIGGRHRIIYKYYPFNINTIDALVNQYFYFPSKDHLNDPIELPTLDGIGGDQLIDSDYRICSFTDNNNSMLMWSHYTQNHEGIMIEYKFGHELPEGVGVSKVEYTNEHKRNKEQSKYLFNQYLLTKNRDWSYEKEIRLISYKRDKVYFEKCNHIQRDRNKIHAEILSITLGCKFPEAKLNLIKNIISTINNRKGAHEPKIKMRKAMISKDDPFKLEYFDLNL